MCPCLYVYIDVDIDKDKDINVCVCKNIERMQYIAIDIPLIPY